MALAVLQVLRFFDEFTRPPKPKMMVCVEPQLGYFFRINSRPWPVAVAIARTDHSFLHHDSYIECSSPLELSDYIVDQSRERYGLLGLIRAKHAHDISEALARSPKISPVDRRLIIAALTA